MVHPGACNTFNFIVLAENANRLTNDEFAFVDTSSFFLYLRIYIRTRIRRYVSISPFTFVKERSLKEKGLQTEPDTNLSEIVRSSKRRIQRASVTRFAVIA